MPKKARLARADFKDFPRAAHREHGRFFTLVVAPRAGGSGPKAACVVSKKIAARAVDRNRIKRRARAALNDLLRGVMIPLSLAFYAKKGAREASYADISEDIRQLVVRAARA